MVTDEAIKLLFIDLGSMRSESGPWGYGALSTCDYQLWPPSGHFLVILISVIDS